MRGKQGAPGTLAVKWSCVDRTGEWRKVCSDLLVYGRILPSSSSSDFPAFARIASATVLNFLHEDDENGEERWDDENKSEGNREEATRWLTDALEIDASITQMAKLLRDRYAAYTDAFLSVLVPCGFGSDTKPDLAMADHDKNTLESTVVSYAASTANQIDTLRQTATYIAAATSDAASHRAGIASCLVMRLKTHVVDKLAIMQKLRARDSVSALRHPLLCTPLCLLFSTNHKRHKVNEDNDIAHILDDEQSDDYEQDHIFDLPRFTDKNIEQQRELREREEERQFSLVYGPHHGDNSNYYDHELLSSALDDTIPTFPIGTFHDGKHLKPTAPPPSEPQQKHLQIHTTQGMLPTSHTIQKQNKTRLPPLPMQATFMTVDESEMQEEQLNHIESLQRESAYLSAKLQSSSALDSVQNVEQRMLEITSLLTHFSSLIGEQQEEIALIYQNTTRSKENINRGGEQLVKANERKAKSRHWTATFIFVLGLILLFFNWLAP